MVKSWKSIAIPAVSGVLPFQARLLVDSDHSGEELEMAKDFRLSDSNSTGRRRKLCQGRRGKRNVEGMQESRKESRAQLRKRTTPALRPASMGGIVVSMSCEVMICRPGCSGRKRRMNPWLLNEISWDELMLK